MHVSSFNFYEIFIFWNDFTVQNYQILSKNHEYQYKTQKKFVIPLIIASKLNPKSYLKKGKNFSI